MPKKTTTKNIKMQCCICGAVFYSAKPSKKYVCSKDCMNRRARRVWTGKQRGVPPEFPYDGKVLGGTDISEQAEKLMGQKVDSFKGVAANTELYIAENYPQLLEPLVSDLELLRVLAAKADDPTNISSLPQLANQIRQVKERIRTDVLKAWTESTLEKKRGFIDDVHDDIAALVAEHG